MAVAYEQLEELEIFRMAEQRCDRFYELISPWQSFERDTIRKTSDPSNNTALP